MKRWRLLIHARSSLWLVPVLCVLAGVGISVATIAVDRTFGYDALPRSLVSGPDAATAILTTVAASMVSLTALVLTITMVVVQLAMGQFSPRIVQRILRDKPSQLAIAVDKRQTAIRIEFHISALPRGRPHKSHYPRLGRLSENRVISPLVLTVSEARTRPFTTSATFSVPRALVATLHAPRKVPVTRVWSTHEARI